MIEVYRKKKCKNKAMFTLSNLFFYLKYIFCLNSDIMFLASKFSQFYILDKPVL